MKSLPNIELKVTLMKKGVTQRELAFGSGINESRISGIIKGYYNPTSEVKSVIASFLGMDPQELFPETKAY